MILNHEKIMDITLYEAKVGCINCDSIKIIGIKKGSLVDEWLKTQKVKCHNCECLETLQSWKQYMAGRAMLSQIIELSKKEEDIESRRFGHIA